MAWGGMGGAAGFGMPAGGGHGSARSQGLPFAGVPDEMRAGVEKLLGDEPKWPTPKPEFAQREEQPRVSLRRMLDAHRGLLVRALLLMVLEAALLQAMPYLGQIGIDEGIIGHDWGVILATASAAIIAVIAGTIASGLRVAATGKMTSRTLCDLRIRLFTHLQRLSLDYFTDEKAGVIMTRLTSDIEAIQQFLQEGLAPFLVQGLTMVIVTAVLFTYNVELAALTVVVIVPIVTVLSLWFRAASDRAYQRVRDGIAGVLSHLAESLAGIRIVVGFNRQRHNVLHHRDVTGEYRQANYASSSLAAIYGASSDAVGILGQAMLLLVGGNMVRNGTLQIGELAAFLLYLNSFFLPIQQLVQQYNTYQQSKAAIVKVNELLATRPSVEEALGAQVLPTIQGRVTFEHVSFGYDPAKPVLEDVSLDIAPGETISFVGPTGAGKSTLAKLVVRFYDPTAGRVLIDGHDLREATLRSLREQLGVVPQEPYLFMGTLRDNVVFAQPDADDETVENAIEQVGLTELIDRLPEGLETPVHERGVSMSSGERQLIALARAFLARPRVLVLDEATSNLDLKSEVMVEGALDALLEGRTAIIVAHRLSTAMRADRIAVIDDGRISELGSHAELVELGGRYAEMYAAWVEHLGGESLVGSSHGAPD